MTRLTIELKKKKIIETRKYVECGIGDKNIFHSEYQYRYNIGTLDFVKR